MAGKRRRNGEGTISANAERNMAWRASYQRLLLRVHDGSDRGRARMALGYGFSRIFRTSAAILSCICSAPPRQ
jgi:hypothetical protein